MAPRPPSPLGGTAPATGRVVYGGYGSNLLAARLRAYVEGSPPAGPYGAHRGSSDPTSPVVAGELVALPGRLRFGGWSTRWGGGVAFVDIDGDGEFLCRPYDLSVQQLRDLVAQENGPAMAARDLPAGLGIDAAPLHVGGRYDLVASVRAPTGRLVRVITSATPPAPAAPAPAYLRIVADGLREAGLGAAAAARYLAAATDGLVDPADVAAAVGA